MNKIEITPEIQAKLNGLDRTLELANESGKTIGYFVPSMEYVEMMTLVKMAMGPTPEEREAAWKDFHATGGLTTAQAIDFVRTGKLPERGNR